MLLSSVVSSSFRISTLILLSVSFLILSCQFISNYVPLLKLRAPHHWPYRPDLNLAAAHGSPRDPENLIKQIKNKLKDAEILFFFSK